MVEQKEETQHETKIEKMSDELMTPFKTALYHFFSPLFFVLVSVSALMLLLGFLMFVQRGSPVDSQMAELNCVNNHLAISRCTLHIAQPISSAIGSITLQNDGSVIIKLKRGLFVDETRELANKEFLKSGRYVDLVIEHDDPLGSIKFQAINDAINNNERALFIDIASSKKKTDHIREAVIGKVSRSL